MSEPREAALIALYEAAMAGLDEPQTAGLSTKAKRFVTGVTENLEEIDGILEAASHNWKLARMPVVDRSVLRVAVFELHHTETPVGVVISEAIELAKRYSTERSGAFVNGVLAALAESVAR